MIPVLSRQPVALADAGASLTELYVSCFRSSSCAPTRRRPVAELELQLRSAFASLQVFDFGYRGINQAGIRKKPLPEVEMAYMRAHLRAVVTASPQLRTLGLECYPHGINSRFGDRDEDLLAPGSVFGSPARGSGDNCCSAIARQSKFHSIQL